MQTVSFYKQRGVALLVMIMIAALVSVVSYQLLDQSFIDLRRHANRLQFSEALESVKGVEKLAVVLMTDFFESRDDDVIHFGQPWHRDVFTFPIDAGEIRAKLLDGSACFNLNLLSDKKQQSGGQQNKKNLPAQYFQRLIEKVASDLPIQPKGVRESLKDWIDRDDFQTGVEGAEDLHYLARTRPYRTANQPMLSKTELRAVRGVSQTLYARLAPLICVGSKQLNSINLNTLTAEQAPLIEALYKNMPRQSAVALIQSRPTSGWTREKFDEVTAAFELSDAGRQLIGFDSRHFRLLSDIKYGQIELFVETTLEYSGEHWMLVARHFGE